MHQSIIDELYSEYLAKGYVSEDSVFDALIKHKLPLDEVDHVCDVLLSKGIIIRDDAPLEIDVEIYDRSQLNYDDIYNEIIEIDNNLKPFVDEIRMIVPPQHQEWHNLPKKVYDDNDSLSCNPSHSGLRKHYDSGFLALSHLLFSCVALYIVYSSEKKKDFCT